MEPRRAIGVGGAVDVDIHFGLDFNGFMAGLDEVAGGFEIGAGWKVGNLFGSDGGVRGDCQESEARCVEGEFGEEVRQLRAPGWVGFPGGWMTMG